MNDDRNTYGDGRQNYSYAVHGEDSVLLKEFKAKIEKCETRLANFPEKGWKKWKRNQKLVYVLTNLFLWGIPLLLRMWFPIYKFDRKLGLCGTEKEKLAIIDNFSMVNDRNSTIEALSYIHGKMRDLSNAHAMERPEFWMDVWMQKAEQLYSQSKSFCPDDETIENLWMEIQELRDAKSGAMRLRRVIFMVLIALDAMFLALFWTGRLSVSPQTAQAEYLWPENEFTELLPDPVSARGKILIESAESFSIELYNVRQIQYENYILECKEKGFVVDFNRSEGVCTAANSDGYILVLNYDEDGHCMTVTVSYPGEAEIAGEETE